jgi:hypothetical protein
MSKKKKAKNGLKCDALLVDLIKYKNESPFDRDFEHNGLSMNEFSGDCSGFKKSTLLRCINILNVLGALNGKSEQHR